MNRILKGSAVCIISITAMNQGANADDRTPDPGFLEFLGKTLELEQLGVNVDELIEQRLLVQNQKKQTQEKTEVPKP